MFGIRKSKIITDTEKIQELLTRGVEEVVVKEKLEKKLQSGDELRIKLGIDPTSEHIHLGRSVQLLKLKDFQDLGHKIVLIVGDFTGIIGDTSDKESERPMLSAEQVKENQRSYLKQIGKVIDIGKAEVHYNSKWLSKLTYSEIGEQADQFSVADFIARENIKKRLDGGTRVSLREVLYPLMQGYDSVATKTSVELGGTDQRFNLLAGRKLQEHVGQPPQNILMMPLIRGFDGRKMSSSWGNTINILDEPGDMYGKVMSMADEQTITYFTLCTRVPTEEVASIEKGIAAGSVHPRDAKMRLAQEIVTIYHGKKSAETAEQNFVKTFTKGGMPEDTKVVSPALNTSYIDILRDEGIVTSKNEFRRLIAEGAITSMITHEKITNEETVVTKDDDLKIGKRRFLKIRVQ